MKRLIAILLIAILLASGLGGFAYANSNPHIPWLGDKLIGTARFGSLQHSPDEHSFFDAQFTFTNPDCVNEIKIGGISIIREDGAVIYEGPYLLQRLEDGEIVESTPVWLMEPHAIWPIPLEFFMPDPDDPDHEWKNPGEAINQPCERYTVEISWGVHRGGGLPLIGEVMAFQRTMRSGQLVDSAVGRQMVNMKQRLRSAR